MGYAPPFSPVWDPLYLTAIIDWDVGLTLDKSSAIEVLERALKRYGAPEIFNSDHAGRSLRELLAHASRGVQFTSPKFLDPLKETTASISMDGKGRALDNVIIERFWRTLKYDEVYLNDYTSPAALRLQPERHEGVAYDPR